MTPDEFKAWIMEMRGDTVVRWLRGEIDEFTLFYCMLSGGAPLRYLAWLKEQDKDGQVGHNSTGSGTSCPLDNGSITCACPQDHEA
jgi:hypothetical protein